VPTARNASIRIEYRGLHGTAGLSVSFEHESMDSENATVKMARIQSLARTGQMDLALQEFTVAASNETELWDMVILVEGMFVLPSDASTRWIGSVVESKIAPELGARTFEQMIKILPVKELTLKRRLYEHIRASRAARTGDEAKVQAYAYGSYLEAVAGNVEASQTIYDEGAKLFPNKERLERYYALGRLYLGKPEAALEAYQRAEAIAVSKKETGYLLWIQPGQAAALWKLGRKDEAVEVCRKLAGAFPEFKTMQAAKQWKMVTTANLPPPDMTPFYDALEEMLRRHPELGSEGGK
jgi:tetratricopeptide (TPR) repeat protein